MQEPFLRLRYYIPHPNYFAKSNNISMSYTEIDFSGCIFYFGLLVKKQTKMVHILNVSCVFPL